jgi:hypothetical protein
VYINEHNWIVRAVSRDQHAVVPRSCLPEFKANYTAAPSCCRGDAVLHCAPATAAQTQQCFHHTLHAGAQYAVALRPLPHTPGIAAHSSLSSNTAQTQLCMQRCMQLSVQRYTMRAYLCVVPCSSKPQHAVVSKCSAAVHTIDPCLDATVLPSQFACGAQYAVALRPLPHTPGRL